MSDRDGVADAELRRHATRFTLNALACRWSDGTQGEALRWYGDEVLVCEGDLVGKTQAQLRSLHFRRDRDWLQS